MTNDITHLTQLIANNKIVQHTTTFLSRFIKTTDGTALALGVEKKSQHWIN